MRVIPVPCLRDNYAYLVEGDEPGVCAVVDPSESEPVAAALAQHGLRVGALLLTHHHHDHVGGLPALRQAYPDAPAVALEPDASKIEGITRVVAHDESLSLAGLAIQVLHIPGHTLGAVAYLIAPSDGTPPVAFTGDTLFGAGCGRLFEGTAPQMSASLNDVLGTLPAGTRLYCGHEYTESNLRFAAHVEPASPAIAGRQQAAAALRARGEPTVPSTLADERATNPFLRLDTPAVRAFAGLPADAPAADVFAHLRSAKDTFRG